MNNIETMKLALEALTKLNASPHLEDCEGAFHDEIDALRQAIEQTQHDVEWEKLYRLEVKKKEAIAAKYEQDIKPMTKIVPMAQQEEPVAFMCKRDDGHFDVLTDQTCKKCFPVYTSPPPRQLEPVIDKSAAIRIATALGWTPPRQPEQAEPVAWRNAAIRVGEDLCSVGPFGYYDMTAEQWLDWALSVVTVHAAPPSRQPLTDEEIEAISAEIERSDFFDCVVPFARAIEAKLKENT